MSCVLAVAAACAGGEEPPFRIGTLSDCYGPFSGTHEPTMAAASLPLIERGAELTGERPSAGVSAVSVAGRRVELHAGCAEGTSPMLAEARRLVEEENVDVLVGPLTAENGLALREYARRRPETTFVMMPAPAQELTLTDPLPNLFRFQTDGPQSMAGLGSHAFRRLGWRRAVIVADDVPFGWQQAAGLVAEFCALGGRVVDRVWIPPGVDAGTLVPRIPRDVDGVFVAAGVAPLVTFVERYAVRRPDLVRRLVASSILLYDPEILQRLGPRLDGLVVSGAFPFEPTPAVRAYTAAFGRAFPSIPVEAAFGPVTFPYRDGVEAALVALEEVDGELSNDGKAFREALGRVVLDSPLGRIRLDGNRQAVANTYLTRVRVGAAGPTFQTLRTVRGVEQTFGGYFRPGDRGPSRSSPSCRRGHAPPWARG
jgi:branched-chain amino acid transport system substrate-binding protein